MKLRKSCELVGSLEELLTQILPCLPVKSLMRFKLVSKNWQSLITSSRFSLQYNPRPNPAVGFFYPDPKTNEYGYINLNTRNTTRPPFKKIDFQGKRYPIWIQDSCNGLLLCLTTVGFESDCILDIAHGAKFFVCNPTTNCFVELPRPPVLDDDDGVPILVCGMNLAFDPTKSSVHKVVCVRESETDNDVFQVEIYSSESNTWRASGDPFKSDAKFQKGVYWNGSVYWINSLDRDVLYFNVDEEVFGEIKIPADPYGRIFLDVSYFGESCGHFHLILCYDITGDDVIVYEMKRDLSELFVKYKIDLTEVINGSRLITRGWLTKSFEIYTLVRGGKKESDAYLVLQVSHKVIMFNLERKTFEVVQNFWYEDEIGYPYDVYDYIESLHTFRVPA